MFSRVVHHDHELFNNFQVIAYSLLYRVRKNQISNPPGSSKHPPENVETAPKKLETPPRNFTDFQYSQLQFRLFHYDEINLTAKA